MFVAFCLLALPVWLAGYLLVGATGSWFAVAALALWLIAGQAVLQKWRAIRLRPAPDHRRFDLRGALQVFVAALAWPAALGPGRNR